MGIDITGLREIDGVLGGALVDSETGFMLASFGGSDFDVEAAGAANAKVVKVKLDAIKSLGWNEPIDDILITLGTQCHLIRPLSRSPKAFLYVALDKRVANQGRARLQLKAVEQSVTL
ncbi:MAG: roadblock/LC7 domain-containing protein [Pseudomonadota bacterium]